jgi:hypothetical protein
LLPNMSAALHWLTFLQTVCQQDEMTSEPSAALFKLLTLYVARKKRRLTVNQLKSAGYECKTFSLKVR